MTIQMTATQLKAHILSVLDDVSEGEEVEITKHGRTVARLVPASGPAPGSGLMVGIAVSSEDDDLLSTGLGWDLP